MATIPGSKSRAKYFFAFSLIAIIAIATTAFIFPIHSGVESNNTAPFYVGVAFCGNTFDDAKLLVDKVKTYTNLFVLDTGSSPVSWNETLVNQICDYAVSQGLNIIVNLGAETFHGSWFWTSGSGFSPDTLKQHLETIKQQWDDRWGSKFLGVYYNDEPGGVQLDWNWTSWFAENLGTLSQHNSTYAQDLLGIYTKVQEAKANGSQPDNYNAEANYFVNDNLRSDPALVGLKQAGITTFTSDYGLYWWDYLGGYDVMLTQLGWNCSLSEQIDLIKGAARLQNKDWGAIITWKYDDPPYLDTGDQIYNQMLTSYQAGAKYVIIFDYPQSDGNAYGILNDEHFIALQRFWDGIRTTSTMRTIQDPSQAEVALVLPQNYGWGMRHPNDTIWGFWGSDSKSIQIGTITSRLLTQYGVNLDIVFDDPTFPVTAAGYSKIYYWNSTI